MATGINVDSNCLDVFQDLKLRKKYKYVIFKISDDLKNIVVDKCSEDAEYDEFATSFPPNSPRYAVYDFEYDTNGEGMREKILFFIWSPDTAKIKEKMMYAASKESIRRKLDGVFTEMQCTDISEISYDAVLDKISRMMTS